MSADEIIVRIEWDDDLEERNYRIFHEDGPISLSETELINEYMRLWEAERKRERDA